MNYDPKITLREAAIILDFYLNEWLTTNSSILSLSEKLRKMATSQNIQIDVTYRNIDMVEKQFLELINVYHNRCDSNSSSKKIYKDIIKIYKEDNELYHKILAKAKSMAESTPQNSRDLFLKSLSEKYNCKYIKNVELYFERMDLFCIKRCNLEQSILLTTDIKKVKSVKKTIEQNKMFFIKYKKDFKNITSALDTYIEFLKNNTSLYAEPEYTDFKNDNEKKNLLSTNEISKYTTESTINITNETPPETLSDIYVVNFNSNPDFYYTKPVYASYFEEEVASGNTLSWKEVYVNIFKKLYEDYEDKIQINTVFSEKQNSDVNLDKRKDFCTFKYIHRMTKPAEVFKDKYLETNYSATAFIRKIKYLLDLCLVDYDNLIIKYRYDANDISTTISPKKLLHETDVFNISKFMKWLNTEQNYSAEKCRRCITLIVRAENLVHMKDAFLTNDYDEFVNNIAYLYLKFNYHFKKYDVQKKAEIIEALRMLSLYLKPKYSTNPSKSSEELNENLYNIPTLTNYIVNDFNISSHPKINIYENVNFSQYHEILKTKFSRGFRLNDNLDIKKFRRYWNDLYSEENNLSNEVIWNYIRHITILSTSGNKDENYNTKAA